MMNVFAYCTLPARPAVADATGVEPLTSPPWSARSFPIRCLIDFELLYFRLHQIEAMPNVWLGEDMDGNMAPALRAEQLRGLDLSNALAVVASCYGTESPFVPALYAAGARAVIAAPGPNFAAGNRVIGADLLVQWLIRLLRIGFALDLALAGAKARLLTTSWRGADRDALAFQIMEDNRT